MTVVATLAADQASKSLAMAALGDGERVDLLGRLFGLRLTTNPGGAFGIFPDAPLLFFFSSVAIVSVVLGWGWRSGEQPLALGLVAGGGLGNLVDRVLRPPGGLLGEVVDFLDFSFWPTFNLADSAIVVGVALLIGASLLGARRRDRE